MGSSAERCCWRIDFSSSKGNGLCAKAGAETWQCTNSISAGPLSESIVLEEDMLSALLLMQDSGSAEMSYLRQMQNSFAGELSLQ